MLVQHLLLCFEAFTFQHCSWHHPCLAHWLKEIKSAVCTKANGKGVGSSVPAALLIPYVTLEQVMSQVPHSTQEGTCRITSCSSTMDPFKLYGCAHASSQPKQQYAFTLRIPSMLFPTPLQSPSVTTQLVEHHTAVIDWPEKNPFPSVGTTSWLAYNKTMRGDGLSLRVLCFSFFFSLSFYKYQKFLWHHKNKEAPFSSLQVLTFCLLTYSARGFLRCSISLGGMHREVSWQQ